MNRRKFIIAGTAGLALVGRQAAAFQANASAAVAVSELGDAEIDYTASGFEFVSQESHEIEGESGQGTWETLTLRSGLGEVTFDFTTIGVVNLPDYVAQQSLGHQAMSSGIEHAVETLETGGYLVMSFDSGVSYLEYQLGAFPSADLIITLTTEGSAFQDELAKTQTIMVGGAPPYLFLAESQIESLEIGGAATVTSVPNRSSRATTTGTTPQPTTGTTTATNPAGSESDFIDAITTHRTVFLTSFGEFMDHLATVSDDATTEAKAAELFTRMNEIALLWQAYPADAGALAVPPGLESLGALYGDWAAAIGEVGTLFEQLYMGVDTTDALVAAITNWETLDAELETELSLQSFGGISRTATALDSIRIGLKATRRAIH